MAPTQSPPVESTPSQSVTTAPRPEVPIATPDELDASFRALSEQISASVAVVVVAGAQARYFGADIGGPAWSTIKVPLAIAALRFAPDQARYLVSAAITRSDNTAAESLWSLLGTPEDAAHAVEAVLRESGDAATAVQSQRIRPGFTPFGQTLWPLDSQARFAWELPCLAGSEVVLDDMHHLVSEHRWGLAADTDAAAKGGWGPGPDGGYLVRQLATVSGESGSFGVAMAAQPHDGSFQSGTAAVDQLSTWIDEHRAQFASTAC